MFKNLTVAKRLALGFGATVAFGVAVVAYATVTMKSLRTDTSELSTDRMVTAAQFSDLNGNLNTTAHCAMHAQ